MTTRPRAEEEMERQWWVIDLRGLYLGKCWATREEILIACGPYCEITGNGVNIYGRP